MTKRITVFIGVFLSILIIIEIWVSHSMINYGENLQRMDNLKRALILENEVLENDIAVEASLPKIASRSAVLGFSDSKDLQYIR
jgi:hypothetical protein